MDRTQDDLPLDAVALKATHNSASGDARRSVAEQLANGVRVLEFDVHDDDFATFGYRLGHLLPGSEVARMSGNPRGDDLGSWLAMLAKWSSAQPSHGPLVLYLDLKDSLADNPSFAAGNLDRLNALLRSFFGPRLFSPSALIGGSWPRVGELRDHTLVVLSGDESTRLAYLRDRGRSPAIAMNERGQILEVHDSGFGALWYWSGEMDPAGHVTWHRHGRYDSGQRPAVALNNDGLIVEVHEDPLVGDDQLWYRVGQLGPDFAPIWHSPTGLPFPGNDAGVAPAVWFVDLDGVTLREQHQSAITGLGWSWDGTYDPIARVVRWERRPGGGRTNDPAPRVDRASRRGRTIEVLTDRDGPFGPDTLMFRSNGGPARRIRYEQIAFVEARFQDRDRDDITNDGALFFAGPAEDACSRAWASAKRMAGGIARLWQFDDLEYRTEPPVSFPATDTPYRDWYEEYCRELGCVE